MEEENDEIMGFGDGDEVMVGQMPTTMVRRHIKKRALRNKALSVSFDDKKLRDFVTGFHKRKKKRRKEAQRQLEEKVRLKRVEIRKKRKMEMEMALNPQASSPDAEEDGNDFEDDEANLNASVSGTMTYDNGDSTIKVTTSAIHREDEDPTPSHFIPKLSSKPGKNYSLAVKTKSLKKSTKQGSHKKVRKPAPQKKEKRGKGKMR